MLQLILRWGNPVLTLTLVALAWAAVRWPDAVGDKDAAATLAGALFGAAALFAGAEISAWNRKVEEKKKLAQERRRVRAALAPEFVRICANEIDATGRLLRLFSTSHSSQRVDSMDPERFIPIPSPVFEKLTEEVLCLEEAEIDALFVFYGGLARTRNAIREGAVRYSGVLNLLFAQEMLGHMQHDLETAATVAQYVWPSRVIQMPGEEAESLTDRLRRQATAVDKALG